MNEQVPARIFCRDRTVLALPGDGLLSEAGLRGGRSAGVRTSEQPALCQVRSFWGSSLVFSRFWSFVLPVLSPEGVLWPGSLDPLRVVCGHPGRISGSCGLVWLGLLLWPTDPEYHGLK